jgi:hypothetical protein
MIYFTYPDIEMDNIPMIKLKSICSEIAEFLVQFVMKADREFHLVWEDCPICVQTVMYVFFNM